MQCLETMLEGDESMEIKGIKYWVGHMYKLQRAAETLEENIRVSLEEKRNFFSFILTVVTVMLAPMTILTGYWGMNFENMRELNPLTYKYLPGVKLMWFTSFTFYLLFGIFMVHYRVFYSAT